MQIMIYDVMPFILLPDFELIETPSRKRERSIYEVDSKTQTYLSIKAQSKNRATAANIKYLHAMSNIF